MALPEPHMVGNSENVTKIYDPKSPLNSSLMLWDAVESSLLRVRKRVARLKRKRNG